MFITPPSTFKKKKLDTKILNLTYFKLKNMTFIWPLSYNKMDNLKNLYDTYVLSLVFQCKTIL